MCMLVTCDVLSDSKGAKSEVVTRTHAPKHVLERLETSTQGVFAKN